MSLLLYFIIFMIAQILFIGTDYWLTLWTNAEELRSLRSKSLTESNMTASILPQIFYDLGLSDFNVTESSLVDVLTNESNLLDLNSIDEVVTLSDWIKNLDTNTGVYVYAIIISGLFLFTMIRTTYFFLICMSASVKLHNKMFKSIIRAQLIFFDENPVGK